MVIENKAFCHKSTFFIPAPHSSSYNGHHKMSFAMLLQQSSWNETHLWWFVYCWNAKLMILVYHHGKRFYNDYIIITKYVHSMTIFPVIQCIGMDVTIHNLLPGWLFSDKKMSSIMECYRNNTWITHKDSHKTKVKYEFAFFLRLHLQTAFFLMKNMPRQRSLKISEIWTCFIESWKIKCHHYYNHFIITYILIPRVFTALSSSPTKVKAKSKGHPGSGRYLINRAHLNSGRSTLATWKMNSTP